MILPQIENPALYAGLYVFDFGEWSAVGYTAEEIAVLLESDEFQDGKVYRIHRVSPDGQMELRGISRGRFQTEGGIFFYRKELDAARDDFNEIADVADNVPPPTRAFLHLADRSAGSAPRFVTALVYPAEYDDEMSRWLLEIGFVGGDFVEGGSSHVTNYYEEANTILERKQLCGRSAIPSRSTDEILASVRRAVQR